MCLYKCICDMNNVNYQIILGWFNDVKRVQVHVTEGV